MKGDTQFTSTTEAFTWSRFLEMRHFHSQFPQTWMNQIYANMLNKSYETKSTVSGRRARWARTNSHASNIKRRTPTQWRLPCSRYCANCPMRREKRDEISIIAYICAQRSAVEYRHLISGTRSSKYCPLWWQMLGKMELLRRIVVFRLLIHSGLRKLWVEMAHFKKYRSFKCFSGAGELCITFHNHNTN